MKFILSVILLFSFATLAQQSEQRKVGAFTTYAKVIKVDSNNVFHLGYEGDYVFAHLSYIRVPIKGEPFFDQAHQILKQLEGEWVRVTEVKRLKTPSSNSFLIYDPQNRSVNMRMIREGLAFPFIADKPPGPLVDLAHTARKKRVGMWSEDYLKLTSPHEAEAMKFNQYLNDQIKVFATKTTEYLFRVGNKAYYPDCLGKIRSPDGFVFDERSAKRRGLTIMPRCHKPKPASTEKETDSLNDTQPANKD